MPPKVIWRKGNIVKVRDKRTGGHKFGYVKTIDGRKFRCSAFSTQRQAEDALGTLVYQHHLAKLGVRMPGPATSLNVLIETYLKDAKDRGVTPGAIAHTKAIIERFKTITREGVKLHEITAEDLRDYRAKRIGAGSHPHTIQLELKRIKTVFLSARRLLEIDWSPPPMPSVASVHQGREITLSDEQIATLLQGNKRDLVEFVTLALHTMLRVRELLGLTGRNVDFTAGIDSEHGRLRFVGEKGKREAALPLTREASEILRERLKKSDRAFDRDYYAIRRAFAKACKTAGIGYGLPDGATLHTLRHSSASYLMNLGVPLPVIQAISRHSDTQMLLKYTHPTAQSVGDAVKKLGKRHSQ